MYFNSATAYLWKRPELMNPTFTLRLKTHKNFGLWFFLSCFCISFLSGFPALGQGNLVVNGGFAAGSTGWTLVRGATVVADGQPGPSVFLGSTNATPASEPTASQPISGLVTGSSYLVTGDYLPEKDRGGAPPTNPSFGVAFDGVYAVQVTASPNGIWQSFSFFYTPGSTSALLSLSSQINGTGVEYAIDNISMLAVPEPSALTLLAVGGSLLFAHQIRKQRCLPRRS